MICLQERGGVICLQGRGYVSLNEGIFIEDNLCLIMTVNYHVINIFECFLDSGATIDNLLSKINEEDGLLKRRVHHLNSLAKVCG